MPVLPTPDQIQRGTLRPDTRVVTADVSQVGRALQTVGGQVSQASEEVDRFMDETAELHARDAMTALKREQNQLTVGKDGYAQLRNGAATEDGVLQKYQQLHKDAVGRLSTGMNSRARGKFERMAKEAEGSFQAGLLTHMMREDLNHRGEVYKAQVAVAAETAGLNYNNPEALQREKANVDATVAEYIQKNGITNPELQERMLQDARGTMHQSVVNGYIEAGRAGEADAYFKANRQEFTPERAKSISNMLEPQMANAVGREVAAELFNMHVQGVSEGEIQNRKMQLTDGKSMQVLNAAEKFYNDQVKAREADRVKTSGEILLDAFNGVQGSGISDSRLRAIDAADPVFGVQIREKIEAIQKKRAGEGVEKQTTNMALYAELTDRIRNGESSSQEIIQYAGSLRDADVKALLNKQASFENAQARAADKEAAAADRYRIRANIINGAMPKSANSTDRKAAFRGYVERALQDWKDANPGKVPTTQEERGIIASAVEEHIEVGFLGWTSEVEAYLAEEGRTYPAWLQQSLPNRSKDELIAAYSFIQNIRARWTKDDPPLSDAEIIKVWEQRQQSK